MRCGDELPTLRADSDKRRLRAGGGDGENACTGEASGIVARRVRTCKDTHEPAFEGRHR